MTSGTSTLSNGGMRHERDNEVVAFLFIRWPHEPHEHIAHVVGQAIMVILLAELFTQPDVSAVVNGVTTSP